MDSSPEVEFYKRHHKGQIEIGGAGSREVAVRSLLPNGRYGLVDKHFQKGRKPTEVVVELGSGNAQSLLLLQERYGLRNVTAVDVAFEDGTIVNGVALRNFNLNQDWPFEDGSIDCLISVMIYEHLFDPFHSFDETRRVLSENGRAYINLPLISNLKNRIRIVSGQVPVTSIPVDRWFEERHWDGNHLHNFTISTIKRLCEHSGLSLGAVHGVGRFAALKNVFPSLLCSEISFEVMRKQ